VRSISVPIAGIVAAALLDNRLSWRTVASVLVALAVIASTGGRPIRW